MENSTLASYTPDMREIDSPREILLDAFATYGGPVPANREQWLKLCYRLVEMGLEGISPDAFDTGPSCATVLTRFADLLRTQDEVKSWKSLGVAMKRSLQENPDSFEEIAREMGYGTRATPHKHFRIVQMLLGGIRSRGDKSNQAREDCKNRRIGQKRAPRNSIFTLHIQLS